MLRAIGFRRARCDVSWPAPRSRCWCWAWRWHGAGDCHGRLFIPILQVDAGLHPNTPPFVPHRLGRDRLGLRPSPPRRQPRSGLRWRSRAVCASTRPSRWARRMIHCEGLVKIYRIGSREVVALQGLELQVAAGEVLASAAGAGKENTLLNVLHLDRPPPGSCRSGGRNLAEMSGGARPLPAGGRGLRLAATGPKPHWLSHRAGERDGTDATGEVPCRARRERATALLAAVGWVSGWHTCRHSSLAASSSGSRLPWPWPTALRCCWPTSSPASWTCHGPRDLRALPARSCSATRSPSSSSPTTRISRSTSTAW